MKIGLVGTGRIGAFHAKTLQGLDFVDEVALTDANAEVGEKVAADLESRFIGRIDIRDDYTLVDLPEGMPPELLQHMQTVRVASKPLRMKVATDADIDAPKRKRGFGPPRGDKPGGPRKPGGFKAGAPKPGGFKPRSPR